MATTVVKILDDTGSDAKIKGDAGSYTVSVGTEAGSTSDPAIENTSSETVTYWLELRGSEISGESGRHDLSTGQNSYDTDSQIDFNSVPDASYDLYVYAHGAGEANKITLTVTKSSDGGGGND